MGLIGEHWYKHLALALKSRMTHSAKAVAGEWLHPCEIDGKRVLFHCPHLPQSNPTYFKQLLGLCQANNVELLADRRNPSKPLKQQSRRKALLKTVLFTCAMSAAIVDAANADNTQLDEVELYLNVMHEVQTTDVTSNKFTSPVKSKGLKTLAQSKGRAEYIAQVLRERWRGAPPQGSSAEQVINELSNYYGQFPNVHALFVELSGLEWTLRYGQNTFETKVRGSRMSLTDLTVTFDPLSGAQFKFNRSCAQKPEFCFASPADLLLHELLHVTGLVEGTGYSDVIAGSMAGVYPYQHEYKTIEREKALYRAMRLIDHKPRPMRNEHFGRTVQVSCSTCLH